MRTTKKFAVLCMVLLMGIIAVMPSTFSWYDHNGSRTGVGMSYERDNLPVSAGTLSITTKRYRMDDDNKVYYDNKGNKEYKKNNSGVEENPIASDSVSGAHSQYYGTTITNSGDSPAYVNLYLNNFTNNNKFYVGTMEPSLRDKGISSSVNLKEEGSVRVYFQWANANNWNDGWKNGDNWNSSGNTHTYVFGYTKSGGTYYHQIDVSGQRIVEDSNNSAQNVLTTAKDRTYWVDLDAGTTKFFFAVDDGNGNWFNTSTGATTMNWYRTNDITDVQAGRCYYLTGKADDTHFTAAYESFEISGGISVMKYFDKAYINKDQSAYLNLIKGTHYTGTGASYAVTAGGSYVEVNEGTGVLTGKANMESSESATVTTTIKGALGDEKTVTTTVTRPTNIEAMPLAMNIKVPARANGKNGKTLVVWYIRNETSGNSAVNCSFNSIYYTK